MLRVTACISKANHSFLNLRALSARPLQIYQTSCVSSALSLISGLTVSPDTAHQGCVKLKRCSTSSSTHAASVDLATPQRNGITRPAFPSAPIESCGEQVGAKPLLNRSRYLLPPYDTN